MAASAWSNKPWRLFWAPAVLLATAAAALAIDCPLARWCVRGHCPELLVGLLNTVEPFGNGLGVLLIVLLVYQLDPRRRVALPRVLAMAIGAGLTADVVKMLVARVRPCHFDFPGTVADTFGEWLPLLGAGSSGQSFPSAHTATALGLAAALVWLYPRGRWVFLTLAVMVACQRLVGGAHYLSDTLCGAAIGCFVATACLRYAPLAARFVRLEHRLRRDSESPPECVILPVQQNRSAGQAPGDDDRSHAA